MSSSVCELWYPWENSKLGIFLAKKCQKMAIFAKNPVILKVLTNNFNLSLVLAENFLKSSPKCLLACVSSVTRGKIQNW